MSTPINHASEINRRRLQAEAVLLAPVAPVATDPDPEWHDGTGHGAPVAWLAIVLIVAVVLACLAMLLSEWLSAGGWLR